MMKENEDKSVQLGEKKKISLLTIITLIILGFGYSVAYSIPYLKYVFYDGMLEAMGATNTQLGLMVTVYGIMMVPTYIIGGYFADKYGYKKMVSFSLVGTSILTALFAMNLNYKFGLFVWGGLVITTVFAYWPALFKAVRMLATEEDQGKIYGYFTFSQGLGYLIINFVGLWIYDKYSLTGSAASGFRAVLWLFVVCAIISGVISYILLKKAEDPEMVKRQEAMDLAEKENQISKVNVKAIVDTLKLPGVWALSILIFCIYTMHITISYFTPYFSNVLGMTVTFAGVIAVIRSYGLRMIGGPAGGALADKIGSTAKVERFVLVCVVACLGLLLILPKGTSVTLLLIISLVIGLFDAAAMGIQFSIASEVKTPRKYAALVVGIASTIGYLPDMFQHTLFGFFLDKYDNFGYNLIFAYTGIIILIGILLANRIIKIGKQS